MVDTKEIQGGDEGINHFGAVRIRVNGTGNLVPTFYTLDYKRSSQLVPLVMEDTTEWEPVRLANFKSQRAYLKFETLAINERFVVNRIIIYAKPLWSQGVGR
jgi:hypothetical protein